MNDAAHARESAPSQADAKPKAKPKAGNAMSRIKLALLDQYAVPGERGSDPYNTNTSGKAKPDHYRGNARRI